MISPIEASGGSRPGDSPGKKPAARAESRALVVPARPAPRHLPLAANARPSAAFLAHLIATAQQSPQTREKRRIEPQAAILAYEAARARAQ